MDSATSVRHENKEGRKAMPRIPTSGRAWLKRGALLGGTTVVVLGISALVVYSDLRADGFANRLGHQNVGRQDNGSVVVTTNQILTPAGRQLEFRGRPLAVALSPDGRIAAFLNGTYQAIILVDVDSWTVKQEFNAAGGSASFTGLLYSHDGRTLYASQASGRVVVADVAADGMLSLNRFITTLPASTIPYPGREDGDPLPGGLALSEDGATLYVVLSRNNSLAAVDLSGDRLLAEIPVGNAPHAVAVSGDRAYVSNQGGRRARRFDFTNDSSGTPIVASPRSGHAITGTVSVVDLRENREVRAIDVGTHPTALTIDDRGSSSPTPTATACPSLTSTESGSCAPWPSIRFLVRCSAHRPTRWRSTTGTSW